MRRTSRYLIVVVVLTLAACGNDDAAPSGDAQDSAVQAREEVPEVVAVEVTSEGDGTHRFDVTISSPYDRPEKYADGWRIVGPDGTVYGLRELTHDHAAEQPFTRFLTGVAIPAEVGTVVVQARDLVDGWSDATFEVEVPDEG